MIIVFYLSTYVISIIWFPYILPLILLQWTKWVSHWVDIYFALLNSNEGKGNLTFVLYIYHISIIISKQNNDNIVNWMVYVTLYSCLDYIPSVLL